MCRVTRLVLAFSLGDRSNRTGQRTFLKVRSHCLEAVYTDFYPAYDAFVPWRLHKKGKAGTFTVESKNSQIRHYLARFHRKTKCYSKSIHMVIASLNLLFLKLRYGKTWTIYII